MLKGRILFLDQFKISTIEINNIGSEAEFCFIDSYLEFKDGLRLEMKKASFTLRSEVVEPLQITEKQSLLIYSTQPKLLCALEKQE